VLGVGFQTHADDAEIGPEQVTTLNDGVLARHLLAVALDGHRRLEPVVVTPGVMTALENASEMMACTVSSILR